MKTEIEDFKTGWYGLKLELSSSEIDSLIEFLQELKMRPEYHFHLFSTRFDELEGGIADIEFVLNEEQIDPNMDIGA